MGQNAKCYLNFDEGLIRTITISSQNSRIIVILTISIQQIYTPLIYILIMLFLLNQTHAHILW
jgi:hypothetical protein